MNRFVIPIIIVGLFGVSCGGSSGLTGVFCTTGNER